MRREHLQKIPDGSEILKALPELTRERLDALAKHLDVPPLIVIRIIVADAYESMIPDTDE